MATLVVEQGRTIDSQHSLIKQLFKDSMELTSLKGALIQKQHVKGALIQKQHAQAQAQAEETLTPRCKLRCPR